MEKILVTFANTYETDRNGAPKGDMFPEIIALGYSEEEAKQKALITLKYACCDDFTRPSSCRAGYTVEYFAAEGVLVPEGVDEDDIADELGWDGVCVFDFDGKKYAFSPEYNVVANNYGAISSDEVRTWENWSGESDED